MLAWENYLLGECGLELHIIGVAVLILILSFALYQGLTIRYYRLNSNKIIPGRHIRLALISDLHSHVYGNKQDKLIKIIVGEKPDIILLAGDIGDASASFAGAALLLAGIANTVPIFYVTGNHEYRSGMIDAIRKEIVGYGAHILADEYQKITIRNMPVIIAGIDDPVKTKYEDSEYDQPKAMEKAFNDLQGYQCFKILVSHRPEQIELYKRYPFDLVVSGHSHGGQVRIPYLLNGLWTPHQGLFPKYSGGLYRYGDLTHIVSRGIAFSWLTPRIFNPPEVVIIDIEQTKEEG